MPDSTLTPKQIGFFGLPASGKSWFCENSFSHSTIVFPDGTKEATYGSYTEGDPIVYNVQYHLDTMKTSDEMKSLIKSLDHVVVLFKNDIDSTLPLINFLYDLNPDSLMIVLTHYYDIPYGTLEYVEIEFSQVSDKVSLIYLIDKKKYDWNLLCDKLTTNKVIDDTKFMFSTLY